MPADPGLQLRSLLMLGHWATQRAALDRAAQAVPTDPADWADTGITTALWAARIGEQLTEEVPTIIKDSGMRPAHAVVALIRTALLFGIEVGRQLERQDQPGLTARNEATR